MTKTEANSGAADPFELWRQLYEANESAWSAALEQAVSSPEFGESSGKMLETMLAAQKSVRDNMRTYLETMNVPTREDIARLGELVVGLEEKVDQLGDRLEAIEVAVRGVPTGPAGPAGPAGPTGPTGPTGPAGSVEPVARAAQARPVSPSKPRKPARPVKGVKPAGGAR